MFKKFLVRLCVIAFILTYLHSCGILQPKNISTPKVAVSMDLTAVENDQVSVRIDPLKNFIGEVIFHLPKLIPGTYENSDFGRFVSQLKVYDYNNKRLYVERIDANTWRIPQGQKLDYISYQVDDTFDSNEGKEIYPMGGTKIEKGEVFLLNLHGFIGYFEGGEEWAYRLTITSPDKLRPYTAMTSESLTKDKDVFLANRYFNIIDDPIMYAPVNNISFELDDITVNLAVYSPSEKYQATDFKETLFEMMKAQKRFLGEANTTEHYEVLLLLMDEEELNFFGGMQGALEHHRSTTVVFYENLEASVLKKYITDIVSHEFFHTLTPLNIHSEQIHNFNYNEAVMSQHLWLYEGTTEYFSHLFQVQQGLIDSNEFYDRLLEMITKSKRYDDAMSFTEMSTNIVEEPYQSNYPNVYQKGPLINLCLDLIIREITYGQKGILNILQDLSKKYGVDQPFEDASLFREITAMSSALVGAFFKKHVIGNTPIDYENFFNKIGLRIKEETVTDSNIVLIGKQFPFITVAYSEVGEETLLVQDLNAPLKRLGFEIGDRITNFNGKQIPSNIMENIELVNDIFEEAFEWEADDRVFFEIERNGNSLHLEGQVNGIQETREVLRSIENPNQRQLELRNAWLQQSPAE